MIFSNTVRRFMQIIGKVRPDNCIEIQKLIPMTGGENFDIEMYHKVVELSNNKFKHLFV